MFLITEKNNITKMTKMAKSINEKNMIWPKPAYKNKKKNKCSSKTQNLTILISLNNKIQAFDYLTNNIQ